MKCCCHSLFLRWMANRSGYDALIRAWPSMISNNALYRPCSIKHYLSITRCNEKTIQQFLRTPSISVPNSYKDQIPEQTKLSPTVEAKTKTANKRGKAKFFSARQTSYRCLTTDFNFCRYISAVGQPSSGAQGARSLDWLGSNGPALISSKTQSDSKAITVCQVSAGTSTPTAASSMYLPSPNRMVLNRSPCSSNITKTINPRTAISNSSLVSQVCLWRI